MARAVVTGRETLLRKITKKMEEVVLSTSENRVRILIEDLRLATPIDTGYARSQWTYTVNDSNTSGLAYGVRTNFLNLFNLSYTVKNDAEYIVYLNQGSSKQAPKFFIEKTIIKNGFSIDWPIKQP